MTGSATRSILLWRWSMDRIDEAVSGVLSRLPECRADAAALRTGLEYFGADVNALQ